MKALLFGIGLSLLMIPISSKLDSTVYICMGKSSKKYHYSPNCRGLSNCSTDTYKVSLSKAKQINRTLCGWED
jgi:hypothetical protein